VIDWIIDRIWHRDGFDDHVERYVFQVCLLPSASLYSTDQPLKSSATRVVFPLITGLGMGCLFQTPLIGLQAAMPLKDRATSTATFGLLRLLGGTVGLAIGQAVYSSVSCTVLLNLFLFLQYLRSYSPVPLNESHDPVPVEVTLTGRTGVGVSGLKGILTRFIFISPLIPSGSSANMQFSSHTATHPATADDSRFTAGDYGAVLGTGGEKDQFPPREYYFVSFHHQRRD
jgi:hypothetical protein